MISITRLLARRLRAVLRRSALSGPMKHSRVAVRFEAGRDGLRVQVANAEAAVEYQQPGSLPADQLTVPAEALVDWEGSKAEAVTLENLSGGVEARWEHDGVPQHKEYPASDPEKAPALPDMPQRWMPQGPELITALDQAAQTAATNPVRYALSRLQLRGSSGQIVASDGRQLLVQRGFTFPWKEDLLVTAITVYGCKEVSQEKAISIGKTDTHVGLRIGPWTFLLVIDKDGRFPKAEQVIPSLSGASTRCLLSPADIELLARTLPRMPGAGDDNEPLTLDLNGHLAVRARAQDQNRITEVILAHSEVSGPPVRLVSDRQFLARALALGFDQLWVVNANTPLICQDARRTYVWMPLDKTAALPPSEDAIQITSPQLACPAGASGSKSRKEKVTGTQPAISETRMERVSPAQSPVSTQSQLGEEPVLQDAEAVPRSNGKQAPKANTASAIAEVQALRDLLRDAYTRTSHLLTTLKQHKQQTKLLTSTMSALRQLRHIDD